MYKNIDKIPQSAFDEIVEKTVVDHSCRYEGYTTYKTEELLKKSI